MWAPLAAKRTGNIVEPSSGQRVADSGPPFRGAVEQQKPTAAYQLAAQRTVSSARPYQDSTVGLVTDARATLARQWASADCRTCRGRRPRARR